LALQGWSTARVVAALPRPRLPAFAQHQEDGGQRAREQAGARDVQRVPARHGPLVEELSDHEHGQR
jgi:hypothetical protein